MKFILEEIPTLGGSGIRRDPERFEWDVEHMNAPQKPVNHPGEQRLRRQDYPGSIGSPTIQVLGAKMGPQTFRGLWSDRFNAPGYAKSEKRRFLGVCYRGNAVRIQFDDIDLLGVLKAWDFPYQMDWRIAYEFTVEVANDGIIDKARLPRNPETVVNPRQLLDEVELSQDQVQAQQNAHAAELAQALAGDLSTDVAASILGVDTAIDEVADVIDARLSGLETLAALVRCAQGFRSIRVAALTVLDDLSQAKADADLQYRTATNELKFETWKRSISFETRLMVLSTIRAERMTAERADPVALATYRPRAGESLYDVSQVCYGTPHNWRPIADRNRLESFVLDGTELLVIPEVLVGA